MNPFENQEYFWVFGYGSLMWNPGFEFDVVETARMEGVHRSPCIYSWVHRGTRERPGIVLGLDEGGTCYGKAFKVRTKNYEPVIQYLRDRELVTNVYLETQRPAELKSGESVNTVTYMVDRGHDQYAGQLQLEALVKQIIGAVGQSGANEDYIIDTANHLKEIGIDDPQMQALAEALQKAK